MGGFLERNIVEPGKLPLLLCLAAFVLTFVGTRVVTRMIRAGVGPFRNNVSQSGVHVHHVIPGVLLLLTGAVLSIAGPPDAPWREIAAVMIGAGAALVLDEFALVLHLEDVYWTREGRVSVEMVGLTVACMGFALVGVSPLGVNGVDSGELTARLLAGAVLAVNVVAVWVALRKGKRAFALLGAFVPVLSWVAAVRLAEPDSRWAQRFYAPGKRDRARARHAALAARFGPVLDRVSTIVAGAMDAPPPERRPGD